MFICGKRDLDSVVSDVTCLHWQMVQTGKSSSEHKILSGMLASFKKTETDFEKLTYSLMVSALRQRKFISWSCFDSLVLKSSSTDI